MMKKNITKSVVFLGITAVLILHLNHLLMPKYIYKNNVWPTTSSYNHFYDMEKNSIDVLFFGSSVAVNAFSPQEIYDRYQIRSYNLGSEQQSIYLSYYWLKEALKYQSPKAVVLDSKFIFNCHPENPINTTEGLTRKCLDPMRLSSVKTEAVNALCDLDEEQTRLSYYLLNIRFHDRWKELLEMDFVSEEVADSQLKGYYAMPEYGPEEYIPFEKSDGEAYAEPHPLSYQYAEKMAQLCSENGIQLLLVTLPGDAMDDGRNNTLERLAEENNADYINFCEKSQYEKLGAKLPRESTLSHENLWGSIKMSRYVGKLLQDTYGVPGVVDEQYEATKDFYGRTKNSCELPHIDNLCQYLSSLKSEQYTVFMTIAVPNDGTNVMDDSVREKLRDLGFRADEAFQPGEAYCLIKSPEQGIREEAAGDSAKMGGIRRKHSVYKMNCSPTDSYNKSLIEIDGANYAKDGYGMNIVVYDDELMKVVDSVCFVTDEPAGMLR